MSEYARPPHTDSDELSLKELILKFRAFYREVLKNWKLIILNKHVHMPSQLGFVVWV